MQGLRGDYDPRSVGRGVAYESFKVCRHLEQVRDARIGVPELAQFGSLLNCVSEADIQRIGDELSYLVDFGKGDVQRPPGVA